MMPRSLSQTGPEKRRFTRPKGTPQIIALLLVLLVDSLVAPHFYQVVLGMAACLAARSIFSTAPRRWRCWRLA